jgi:PST family polysaccharide transporter
MSGQILKNVSRGSFYLATEQFSGLLSGVVYSIVVLRWLGPESYGLLSLGLAIVGLAMVATGNFEVFLERYSAEYETRGLLGRLRRAHGLALALKLGLGVITALVLYGLSAWLAQRYHEPRLAQLLGILAGLIIFEGFTVTGRAVLYGLQRFGWVAFAALLIHSLKIVAVTVLWLRGADVYALAVTLIVLAGLSGALVTTLAAYFVRRGAKTAGRPLSASVQAVTTEEPLPLDGEEPPSQEPSLTRSVFSYCLPLLGARAAYLTGQNLSRVVLGGFLSLEQLGYFSFAATVVERFVGFVYALPSSLLPSLTQLLAKGDRLRFARLLDKAYRLIATAGGTLSFGLFVFAEDITLLVGGEQYLPAVPVLRVMALVPWVRTSQQPLTMAFYALKHTSWVLGLAVLKLGVELASYFLLIPDFGVMGAASAHVMGAAVAFCGALLLVSRSFPPARHRWAVIGKTTVLFFLAAAAALLLAGSGAGLVTSLGVKLLVITPAFLLAVFLCDLVTEDDLRRAGEIDIGPARMRWVRDTVVAVGLRLSRSMSPFRPAKLGTAEGN